MVEYIFNGLALFGIILTLLLSISFFITAKGRKRENRLFSFILLLFFVQIFFSYTTSNYMADYFIPYHKIIQLVKLTHFLLGPALLIYVKMVVNKDTKFSYAYLLTLLPFIIAFIYASAYITGMNRFVMWRHRLDYYFTIGILLQNLVYGIISYVYLKRETIRNRELIKAPYLRWMQIVFVSFIMFWITNLKVFLIFLDVNKSTWCANTNSIFFLSVFILLTAYLMILLVKPELYYFNNKYSSSRLSESEKEKYINKLENFIHTEKPYLNPQLDLEDVAHSVGLEPRELSQIINESYKKNFKLFINEYRVWESMRLLERSEKSILEILFATGFNSKSTFNYQFKRIAQCTPLEYRQNGKLVDFVN
jgi:AraC-like DNA-binding protein